MATLLTGDCLQLLKAMPDNSVDMVFTSPPYEDARTYGIAYKLSGDLWTRWATERYLESSRVSRGLVAWVVAGRTRNFQWSATPSLLIAELHKVGIMLRCPPIYHRVGIPGSGGPDWWRNDYEMVICSAKGKLPWSDNTATGHECKFEVGGAMSYRHADGVRRNQKTGSRLIDRDKIRAELKAQGKTLGGRRSRNPDGTRDYNVYVPPAKANPGNVIKCKAGGGHMGSKLAHENEAPFPEDLVTPFVLSFCPPGGTVLDPFCGSGTTGAVALRHGRKFIGMDIRQSQIDLTLERLLEVV